MFYQHQVLWHLNQDWIKRGKTSLWSIIIKKIWDCDCLDLDIEDTSLPQNDGPYSTVGTQDGETAAVNCTSVPRGHIMRSSTRQRNKWIARTANCQSYLSVFVSHHFVPSVIVCSLPVIFHIINQSSWMFIEKTIILKKYILQVVTETFAAKNLRLQFMCH